MYLTDHENSLIPCDIIYQYGVSQYLYTFMEREDLNIVIHLKIPC